MNLAVVNLAGVPSIVPGLFGLGAFVYALEFGKSILAASCTLAIMTLPVIIASTKEALAAVPVSFREQPAGMSAPAAGRPSGASSSPTPSAGSSPA